jgi:hypothetical protein
MFKAGRNHPPSLTSLRPRYFMILRHLPHPPLSKGCHLDVVRGPSTPHDPESDAGGSLSSWQGHPSR